MFKEVLVFTKDDYLQLEKAVLENFDESALKLTQENEFGKIYRQEMEIKGPNGNVATVVTGWIKGKDDSKLRLTTIFVK